MVRINEIRHQLQRDLDTSVLRLPDKTCATKCKFTKTLSPVQTQISPTKNSKKSRNIEPPQYIQYIVFRCSFPAIQMSEMRGTAGINTSDSQLKRVRGAALLSANCHGLAPHAGAAWPSHRTQALDQHRETPIRDPPAPQMKIIGNVRAYTLHQLMTCQARTQFLQKAHSPNSTPRIRVLPQDMFK